MDHTMWSNASELVGWSNSSPKVLKISVEAMIEVLDRALLGFFMAFTSTNSTFSLQTPQTSTDPYLHFPKNISKLEIPLQDRCHQSGMIQRKPPSVVQRFTHLGPILGIQSLSQTLHFQTKYTQLTQITSKFSLQRSHWERETYSYLGFWVRHGFKILRRDVVNGGICSWWQWSFVLIIHTKIRLFLNWNCNFRLLFGPFRCCRESIIQRPQSHFFERERNRSKQRACACLEDWSVWLI